MAINHNTNQKVKLSIELHDSVKDNPIFGDIQEITIKKPIIFEYGVLNQQVPRDRIGENEFEYLEGLIPSLASRYEDYIRIDNFRIINNAQGEDIKDISEIIGVGVGLYYATKLLGINKNKIKKIPKAENGEKYLDFSFSESDKMYECETKGTTRKNNIGAIIKDVKDKKKNKPDIACRFGVVTLARKSEEEDHSKIVVCDDYDNIENKYKYDIYHYLDYYKFILSVILDNPAYNKLERAIGKGVTHSLKIVPKKISGLYVYNGTEYMGRYFDKRLILDIIKRLYKKGMDKEALFKLLTSKMGREKYFLGISRDIVTALNTSNMTLLSQKQKQLIDETYNKLVILGNDGVIFIKSSDGIDDQVETRFTEQDVKNRLNLIFNYANRSPHRCKAPCRSREIKGKPCDIMTFREHCHFHR